MKPVASKQFSWDDQHSFAGLSGDLNPMHMDPVAARRTSAASPVVHGIHTLVWAIDQLATHCLERKIVRIKANWSHFVHIGEVPELVVEAANESRLKAQIRVESETVATLTLFLGETPPASGESPGNPVVLSPTVPSDLGLDEIIGQSGNIAFAVPATQVAVRFPSASLATGPHPIAGLLTLSRLVGMVCPGLHSIFARLDVAMVGGDATDFISYKVTGVDERFRYVTQSVHGAGLQGTVEAFLRNPPTEQPGMDELSKLVDPAEFRDSAALVIGGSRGLGEVTAKLLAAGGAHVVISYSMGREDAERVALSIRNAGGTCEIMHYDVRNASENQLRDLSSPPTHVYYFATGPISQSRVAFDIARFDEFCLFYVKGFAHLCSCLRQPEQGTVRVFYPSTVYVTAGERPRGFVEYAMAKAAAETLCAEASRSWPHIQVISRRLPRLQTDQTATFLPEEPFASTQAVMLAAIREMQARTVVSEAASK
jgi:NAD(P)-dependent dehydrogenase (short-subunit alcohol dehydrogenase family)